MTDSLTTDNDQSIVSISATEVLLYCVCLCLYMQRLTAAFWIVCFELSVFLMLQKDCEFVKTAPLLLMAGPTVNRKRKVWKETSLRLRWSNSRYYCNDAFALIFFFPTTLEELINILSLKIT